MIANWFVTLFAGQPAGALHRFNAAYARYLTHNTAYLYLVANPFPGFTGAPGSYPIDLRIAASPATEPLEDRLSAHPGPPGIGDQRGHSTTPS